MTFSARRKRDGSTTRRIARITLDGHDLKLCDVYYLDTRRGVVRGYCRNEHGRIYFAFDNGYPEIAKWERRGKVRFWLKGASAWGMSKAVQA